MSSDDEREVDALIDFDSESEDRQTDLEDLENESGDDIVVIPRR